MLRFWGDFIDAALLLVTFTCMNIKFNFIKPLKPKEHSLKYTSVCLCSFIIYRYRNIKEMCIIQDERKMQAKPAEGNSILK
jgi:hypothetical protein